MKTNKWTDIAAISGSLIIIAVSVWWMFQQNTFSFTLSQDEKWVWHLVRSSGVVSYVLLLASTVWGLFISSQFVKDWSPGPVSMTLHSTISWLALLLGLGHGLLLMLDDYFTYSLVNVLVPFTGPYRPLFVGLGTLSFWVILAVSLSFPFKKRLGHQTWKFLHYTSYAAFGMVSLHGLFAGTDGGLLGFRILVGFGIMLVVLLLGIRVGKDQSKSASRQRKATR